MRTAAAGTRWPSAVTPRVVTPAYARSLPVKHQPHLTPVRLHPVGRQYHHQQNRARNGGKSQTPTQLLQCLIVREISGLATIILWGLVSEWQCSLNLPPPPTAPPGGTATTTPVYLHSQPLTPGAPITRHDHKSPHPDQCHPSAINLLGRRARGPNRREAGHTAPGLSLLGCPRG